MNCRFIKENQWENSFWGKSTGKDPKYGEFFNCYRYSQHCGLYYVSKEGLYV